MRSGTAASVPRRGRGARRSRGRGKDRDADGEVGRERRAPPFIDVVLGFAFLWLFVYLGGSLPAVSSGCPSPGSAAGRSLSGRPVSLCSALSLGFGLFGEPSLVLVGTMSVLPLASWHGIRNAGRMRLGAGMTARRQKLASALSVLPARAQPEDTAARGRPVPRLSSSSLCYHPSSRRCGTEARCE